MFVRLTAGILVGRYMYVSRSVSWGKYAGMLAGQSALVGRYVGRSNSSGR